MKTVTEYREQAAKARALAKSAPDVKMRDVIARMAQAWEDLAAERERRLIVRHTKGLGPDRAADADSLDAPGPEALPPTRSSHARPPR